MPFESDPGFCCYLHRVPGSSRVALASALLQRRASQPRLLHVQPLAQVPQRCREKGIAVVRDTRMGDVEVTPAEQVGSPVHSGSVPYDLAPGLRGHGVPENNDGLLWSRHRSVDGSCHRKALLALR